MNDIEFIVQFVAEAVWRLSPLFVLTIFLSTLISSLKFDTAIRAAFERREGLAIILATMVGAFSPLCSCTVIPVIAGLLRGGIPLAPVMAFWIASPTMDPEIFALSVGTLGLPLAVSRLGSTLVLSLAAGYVTLLLTRSGLLKMGVLKSTNEPELERVPTILNTDLQLNTASSTIASTSCCFPASTLIALDAVSVTASPSKAAPNTMVALRSVPQVVRLTAEPGCTCQAIVPVEPLVTPTHWWEPIMTSVNTIDWRVFARKMLQDIWRLGRWLVLAFIVEALILRFVPQQTIASMLGAQNAASVPLAALLGVPLYLSNLSALPIVSGLLEQGMQPGAAIAFLIAGPVTTIPAMSAVWGVVKWRVFVLYLALSLLGAIILGYAVSLILG